MQLRIYKRLFFSFFLCVLASSCKKQLELRPSDVIDEVKAFQSVEDLQKGINGVYFQIGNGLVNGIYINTLIADETRVAIGENGGFGLFTFRWEYTGSAVSDDHIGDYLTFYRSIDRGHRVQNAMAQMSFSESQEVERKRMQAEITGFRGIAHFELLRRFMPAGYDPAAIGVPIVLQSDLFQKPARNTVGEVVAQVEADLAAARSVNELPNNSPTGLKLSKAAIAGYQARVALLKRDWSAALAYAGEAISLSGKSLATPSVYPSIWTDATNDEVILRFANNYSISSLWRSSTGSMQYEPSIKIKSQYDQAKDIRYPTFFGSAGNDTTIVKKYPGNTVGPQTNDLKAMRTSEMYLIQAEAHAELNQLGEAAKAIDAIRQNRISGYTPVTFASKTEAIDAIMNERYKELAFEGFRFFDLKRRSLPIMRFDADVQSANWKMLPANHYKFALPLPTDEIFSNPNSQQNSGY